MPPATIDIDIDPVLHIGGLGIHWYGILYAVAFAVALYLGSVPHLEKRGTDRGTVERYATWAIVAGLIGARLYYVVQSSPPQGGSWFSHPEEIPAVWHGGMAFFGAIIAVPLVLAFLTWRDGRNWWLWADASAIFATIGQPIGRIGNVVNGDILGYSSTLPWATSYSHPDAVLQSGFVNCAASRLPIGASCVAYQPAAVYEALGTLAILGILVTLRMRRNPRAGTLFILYIALYCVSQFLLFFLRGSESTVALGLKQAQWTALVVGLVGVPLLVYAWQRDWLDWAPVGTETGALVGAGGGPSDESEEEDEEPDEEEEEEDEDEDVVAGAEGAEEDEEEPAPAPVPVRRAGKPASAASPSAASSATVAARPRSSAPAVATRPVTPAAPVAPAAVSTGAAPRRRTPGSVTRVRPRVESEPERGLEAPADEPEPAVEEREAMAVEVEPEAAAPEAVEAKIEPEAVEPDEPAPPAATAPGQSPQQPPVDPRRVAGRGGRRRGRGRGRGR